MNRVLSLSPALYMFTIQVTVGVLPVRRDEGGDVQSGKHARSVNVPCHRRQTSCLIRRRVRVGRWVPHHRRVEKGAGACRLLRAPCFHPTKCVSPCRLLLQHTFHYRHQVDPQSVQVFCLFLSQKKGIRVQGLGFRIASVCVCVSSVCVCVCVCMYV